MTHAAPLTHGVRRLTVVLAVSAAVIAGCGNEDVSPVNDENNSVITDPEGVTNSIDGDVGNDDGFGDGS